MFKKIAAIILVFVLCLICLSGCGSNKQIFDYEHNFNYTIIFLPNGDKIEGEVTSWNNYKDSGMIQVKIDGVTYLTHSSNVILEAR